MKKWSLIVIAFLFTLSCEKESSTKSKNAEIISFNPDKCMCCWGWTIKIGDDLIKSDDPRLEAIAGFDIEVPVGVHIELGTKDVQCDSFYEIKSIEIADSVKYIR
jgi:hypothetical protein